MVSTSSDSLAEFHPFAMSMADKAGQVIAQYFRQPVSIDSKLDETPVTVADRETEKAMREMINERDPSHGIFGEEFGSEKSDAKYVWVLDPIDGTRSFITGTPTFGSLIRLLEDGVPSLGIIDMPARGERWTGGRGNPANLNGENCRVSRCETLRGCRLVCTSPDMFDDEQLTRFKRLLQETAFYRYGGDCYNYGLLASGYLDVVVEADLEPYDFCALVPVVESAGGVISDWHGNSLTMSSAGDVVASASERLHEQTLKVLDA